MNQSVLNSVGLILDIIGVVVLFYFGPPVLNITKEGHRILPFDSNNTAETNSNKALAKKHGIFSKLGLGFLMAGFLFQLGGSWL